MPVGAPVGVLREMKEGADALEEAREVEPTLDDRVEASLERDTGAEIGGRGEGRPG